ncbi:hypothetical protein L211DRAFT_262364 [Terfezia boudieri ATCC MYA-4762]|uniref:Uncharacterized protein n=1 Tax=Terfezia boudieri ATCC MYA-4762 TaxID=1051890 RepID=A0A3N4M2G8_9PEZI|nr:hypothetical protein L211DRAFT_262364 [Terfezia boudieri ATCC MYA-4762]
MPGTLASTILRPQVSFLFVKIYYNLYIALLPLIRRLLTHSILYFIHQNLLYNKPTTYPD